MTQLSLFGDAPTPAKSKPKPHPKGDDRLLFALYPDTGAASLIGRRNAGLRAALGLRGRPRPAQVLHITLRHVGDFAGPPLEVVEALIGALADFEFPAFDVTLDGVTRFVGSRAFVLLASEARNAALTEFQRALCTRLDAAGAGWRVGGAGFTPHLTLSYEEREVAVQPMEPIAWTAREFVLTHSLLGQTRHVPLARFSFG